MARVRESNRDGVVKPGNRIILNSTLAQRIDQLRGTKKVAQSQAQQKSLAHLRDKSLGLL